MANPMPAYDYKLDAATTIRTWRQEGTQTVNHSFKPIYVSGLDNGPTKCSVTPDYFKPRHNRKSRRSRRTKD